MIYMYLNGTRGEEDGTKVSEGGSFTNAIKATLNASQNQISEAIEVQLRCDEDYGTVGNVIISLTGSTAHKACLSADGSEWLEWGQALTLVDPNITNKNFPIYIRLKATDDESAHKDTQIKARLEATIQSIAK